MIVADADVIIEYLAKKEPFFTEITNAIKSDRLVTNVVIRYEVLVGETKALDRATRLLNGLRCRILDFRATERAIEAGRALERRGQRIGKRDTLMAGIALVHDDEILTKNREHFDRIKGLKVHPASTRSEV